MVLLRTVHWKVLWGTKTGSSMVAVKTLLEPLFLRMCAIFVLFLVLLFYFVILYLAIITDDDPWYCFDPVKFI